MSPLFFLKQNIFIKRVVLLQRWLLHRDMEKIKMKSILGRILQVLILYVSVYFHAF